MRLFTVSNLFTLGNLLCGCLGIQAVLLYSDFQKAAFLLGIALILDFFDGFIARLLKESSDLGRELDSLADVVSFGVLPGFILWQMMDGSSMAYLAFLIPLFSALRLAKFNIDTRQSLSFIGLPTPANAMVIASLPLIAEQFTTVQDALSHPWVLPTYILLFSYLLISEIPLPALKFKNYSWTDNKFTYTLLILSVILLAVLQLAAIPVIVFGYILYSLIQYIRKS